MSYGQQAGAWFEPAGAGCARPCAYTLSKEPYCLSRIKHPIHTAILLCLFPDYCYHACAQARGSYGTERGSRNGTPRPLATFTLHGTEISDLRCLSLLPERRCSRPLAVLLEQPRPLQARGGPRWGRPDDIVGTLILA